MIIKVCGMREADNIRAIEQLGIQWMGFIFYPHSPRYVNNVPTYLPLKANRIGVFVNDSIEQIIKQTERFGLNAIQLHGQESPEYCHELREQLRTKCLNVFLIKAFSIHKDFDFNATNAYEHDCRYFLFDTPCSQHGGSGKCFHWEYLSAYHGSIPFLLSGGLSCQQLQALKTFNHPQWIGIDLNSGFEQRPAYKDAVQLAYFINEFNNNRIIK